MIELFDPIKILTKENMKLNKYLFEKTKESSGHVSMWSHYQLDYPWIINNLKKLLGSLKGKKILDAGCGKSVLSFYLLELGAEVYSCDINNYEKRLTMYDDRIKFKQCNTGDEYKFFGYPVNFFDAIISVSVIEHMLLYHAKISCENFTKTLKSDGVLLITTNMCPRFKFTDDHIVYDENTVMKIFVNEKLELLNDENNFSNYRNIFFEQSRVFIMNKIMPLEYVAGGVVLKKK